MGNTGLMLSEVKNKIQVTIRTELFPRSTTAIKLLKIMYLARAQITSGKSLPSNEQNHNRELAWMVEIEQLKQTNKLRQTNRLVPGLFMALLLQLKYI